MKEEAEDRQYEFNKLHAKRVKKYDRVQKHLQDLDDFSFSHYPPHLQEVAERIEKMRQQDKIDAQAAATRAQRDEQHLINMHLQL